MVPFTTFIACVITLLISLVLPIVALLVFAVKNKKQGIVSAWLLGAAGFFVSQILIRLPLLTFLQSQSWFASFAKNELFMYIFSLACTAALFELAGRLAAAGIMANNLSWKRSLAAGLGHGGIEAMLLIGMTYVNNLVYITMINSGSFDTMLAQSAALGVDVSQLELVHEQLVATPPVMFLLAGFERLLAMTGHIAMSALVCYGVAHKKLGVCVLACVGLHTMMDMSAGISLVLPQNMAYPLIYTLLVIMAVVSLIILQKLRNRWGESPL